MVCELYLNKALIFKKSESSLRKTLTEKWSQVVYKYEKFSR